MGEETGRVPRPRESNQPPRAEGQGPHARQRPVPSPYPCSRNRPHPRLTPEPHRREAPPATPFPAGRQGGAPLNPRGGSVGTARGPGNKQSPGGGDELRGRRRNPKREVADTRGLTLAQHRPRVTLWPLPARKDDVGDARSAAALGPRLGAVPGDPGLRWGRGRLLHAGPEPRAADARVLLLRGSSGPGGRGRGLREAPVRGGAWCRVSAGRGQREDPVGGGA